MIKTGCSRCRWVRRVPWEGWNERRDTRGTHKRQSYQLNGAVHGSEPDQRQGIRDVRVRGGGEV